MLCEGTSLWKPPLHRGVSLSGRPLSAWRFQVQGLSLQAALTSLSPSAGRRCPQRCRAVRSCSLCAREAGDGLCPLPWAPSTKPRAGHAGGWRGCHLGGGGETDQRRKHEPEPCPPILIFDQVEVPGTRKPASFRVKETVCPRTSQQSPEQCDFRENGVSLGAGGAGECFSGS